MSEKNEKDPTTKKRLKLTKELIEDLKDEDLEKVAGGDSQVPPERTPTKYEDS
jgi:hypothetical protein